MYLRILSCTQASKRPLVYCITIFIGWWRGYVSPCVVVHLLEVTELSECDSVDMERILLWHTPKDHITSIPGTNGMDYQNIKQ